MIRKFFRILLLSILPVYLLVMFFIFDGRAEEEICKELRVEIKDSLEAPFLKNKDVEHVLRKIRFKPSGKPLNTINTFEVSRELEKNQIIRQALCYKTPDGTVRIDIYQRNPILRVMGINGNYYVDEEGITMPVSYNFTAHVPVATGYITKELATKDLHRFAKFLKENSFWNAQIEQIYVMPNGDIELIPKVGSHTILLGSLDNFEQKLDNLITFYQKGLNKKGWNVYKTINLKYENQVIGVK